MSDFFQEKIGFLESGITTNFDFDKTHFLYQSGTLFVTSELQIFLKLSKKSLGDYYELISKAFEKSKKIHLDKTILILSKRATLSKSEIVLKDSYIVGKTISIHLTFEKTELTNDYFLFLEGKTEKLFFKECRILNPSDSTGSKLLFSYLNFSKMMFSDILEIKNKLIENDIRPLLLDYSMKI